MKPDTCDLCGNVDTRLEDGVCAACAAKQPPVITAERLLVILSRHIGSRSGATITQLANEMVSHRYLAPAERSSLERIIQELIVELRLAGHHVCAHPSTGYYMAETGEELDAACKFLFERAMTSLQQVAAMKRVSLPDLRGQLHIPT